MAAGWTVDYSAPLTVRAQNMGCESYEEWLNKFGHKRFRKRWDMEQMCVALAGDAAEMKVIGISKTKTIEVFPPPYYHNPRGGDWARAVAEVEFMEPNPKKREQLLLRVWKLAVDNVWRYWDEIEQVAQLLTKHKTVDRKLLYSVLEKED